MNVLQAIIPFLGILIVLIVVHELGHYLTARLFSVKVLEAGIGYPPRAWGFTWRGTVYSVNWLPLGGFVRLLGEEDSSDPESLAAKPRWQRLIILASGAGMNIILPIFLFAIAFMIPRQVSSGPAFIDMVEEGAPAAEAGLLAGDIILELNGESIKNTQDVSRLIRLNLGETIDFTVKRDVFGGGSEIIIAPVEARWTPPSNQGPTGIRIGNLYPQFTESESSLPWDALAKGWTATVDSLTLARNQIIILLRGGSSPDIAGPVGIAQATGEVVDEAGWQVLLDFAAVLSINLAIINILPLPMLDGGRIAFVLLEVARRGKRIAPEKEAVVHFIGLALILTFAVVITYFDLVRIISGESLFR